MLVLSQHNIVILGAPREHVRTDLRPRRNNARSQMRRNPPGGRSFCLSLRCSLVTDPCGYAPRSRLG